MTIDKAIEFFNRLECHPAYAKDARDVAIETMRKYQKIEEIIGRYGFETSWLCLRKIREVMEDGNNNTDGKKLC